MKRVSRSHLVWTNPLGGSIKLRITHSRDYFAQGEDHLAIESIEPAKAPLPISETGYRSHFIGAAALEVAGGAKEFVGHWLDSEAGTKDWQRRDLARRQGNLFRWAETQVEVGAKAAKKPSGPAARAASKTHIWASTHKLNSAKGSMRAARC